MVFFSVQHFSLYIDVPVYMLHCFNSRFVFPSALSSLCLCLFACLFICLSVSAYACLSVRPSPSLPLSLSSSPGLSVPSTSSVPGSQAHLFHERLSACLIACLLADWKEVWSEQGVDGTNGSGWIGNVMRSNSCRCTR